jgi:hypothetical protein
MTVTTPKRRRTREEEGGDNEVGNNKGKEEREKVRSTRIRISDKNPKSWLSEGDEDSKSLEIDKEGGEEKFTESLKMSCDDSTSTSSNSDHSQITTMNFSESHIDNDSDNAQQTKWSVPCEW